LRDLAAGLVQALKDGKQMRTVGVTGASSQLGVFLLPCLLAAGYRVEAFSRGVASEQVNENGRLRWLNRACGKHLDAFISCGPLSLAETVVRESERLERVVAFSTSSVEAKADSPNRSEAQLMKAISEEEDRLVSACAKRGIGLLLLRPTLIYGCGLDRNISLLARFGKRFGFIPMAGNAPGLRQPVHAADLAVLAVHALSSGKVPDFVSAACGGSTLTYREMVIATAGCFEGVRPVAIPSTILQSAASLATAIPALRGINAEMVRRQAIDLVFDDSALRTELAWNPRPFRPSPEDFEIPADCRLLQLG
jgi:nucleoside-diphosphate-sugar epimerase